ncbi:MAG TPA: hypothetical protein VGD65_07390 [Chryseosolibacter sp.]
MKTRKLTLIFALSTVVCTVFGQDYTFKVLANKGSNEVKSGQTWQPLKTGASLRETDEIKLSDNAYIGLVHKNGSPLEVKKAGNHTVAELAKSMKTGSSVLNKYTDFILSSNSAEAKKNRLSATGAVHRDVTDVASLMLIFPATDKAEVFNSTAIVNWEETKASGPYVVSVLNLFEEEIMKIETPEKTAKIDLADPKLAGEPNLLVEVYSKADRKVASKQHMIKRMSTAEKENVKKALSEIMGEVTEPTALNKLLLAGFYEEKNLIIDAIAAYEEAVQLAPDVPTFKEAYDEFLLRQNLKK